MGNSNYELNEESHNKETLNERLFFSGNMKKFEKAIKNNDRIELLSILESIGLENSDIDFLLKNSKSERKSFLRKILEFF